MRTLPRTFSLLTGVLLGTATLCSSGLAQNWDLATAATPYKGTQIKAVFLDRPGYVAAQKLIPEFEKTTGIKVAWETMPYENCREKQVLDFTGQTGQYDVALVDVVWIGEYASNNWLVPVEKFTSNPKLNDPNLNLKGFFPILLDSFGTWNNKVYGLPFDNYSGVLYYNKEMLAKAGFNEPPKTWKDLAEKYAPALTKDGKYGYALQSRRGETQSCDSFMRVIWAFGGSLLEPGTFKPNLLSAGSQAGIKFRQDLMKYMPPDVVEWDHDEAVQAFAQGRVAMITEWSAFYPTLANKATSTVVDQMGVAVEPAGPDGKPHPALGGFSLAVNAQSDEKKQAAAWLFIQWITSEAKAKDYINAGGVPARVAAYQDEALKKKFTFFGPAVESWENYGNPVFRPRFPEWPAISEIIAQTGSEIMLGKFTPEQGAKTINQQMETLLKDYASGKKPKLQ